MKKTKLPYMKKISLIVICLLTLTACEEASNKLEQAQNAANETIDAVQEKIEAFDLNDLNLDGFGEATRHAKELVTAVQQSLEANLNDPQVFENLQDTVQNAYACMVDATSESKAEQFVNKILDNISDEKVTDLISRSMEKAKDASECIM